MDMDMETLRPGDMEMETGEYGNIDMEHESMEKWRHGDMETWRHARMHTWTWNSDVLRKNQKENGSLRNFP
jgi:hypothetical protein